MKNKKILYWQLGVIFFELILGTILHFTYKWSGNNIIVASFSAVNESTWEHLKLAFFPMLIFSIIEGFFIYKEVNNYLESKTISIVNAMFIITVVFYSYTGILGYNTAVMNILLFTISIIVSELLSYKLFNMINQSTILTKILSIIAIIVLTCYFIIFTYITPKINYFKDPVTQTYGINVNKVSIGME